MGSLRITPVKWEVRAAAIEFKGCVGEIVLVFLVWEEVYLTEYLGTLGSFINSQCLIRKIKL